MKLAIYTSPLLLAISLLSSCGDNTVEGLYPSESVVRSIELRYSTEDDTPLPSLIELPSANGSMSVTVISDTRWRAEITNCEGQWCSLQDPSGNGDGQFTIVPNDNSTGEDRECDLMVRVVDKDDNPLEYESVIIHLVQQKREISITPTSVEAVSSLGMDEIPFTVTSNLDWVISCSNWYDAASGNGFISITPDASMIHRDNGDWTGNGTTSFKISVRRNLQRNERIARITVSSPTGAFLPINVDITQEAAAQTFVVAGDQLAPGDGGDLSWEVYSPSNDWTIKVIPENDWLTLETNSGDKSDDPVTVKGHAKANTAASAREAVLVFRATGDNPEERTITVIQPGTNAVTPTFSRPWVSEEWTSEEIEVNCYYLTNGYTFESMGVEISLADSSNWTAYESETVEGNNTSGGMIKRRISGLRGLTKYALRAWAVLKETGERIPSSTIYVETPATWPGIDDNTTPKP